MEIKIFDVAHGFCAYVVADNGNTMLIDCGHNDQTRFYPATYLAQRGCTGIERFFVLNYDEDHLSGLPRLRSIQNQIPIQILNRNYSVSGEQLRQLKLSSGPLGDGMISLLNMIGQYTVGVTLPPPFPKIEWGAFWNPYPTFTDTNNLSQVLFLHYPGISIVFPGDLERAGWTRLLQRQDFRTHLSRVNMFVASHHGRASGFESAVFEYCKPDIVIISDEGVKYETQEHSYSQYAHGIRWNGDNIRRTLSTRNDGMITITSQINGSYFINAVR